MKAKIVTRSGEIVEGVLITPKNAKLIDALRRDTLNVATGEYLTLNEASAVMAYVLSLVEQEIEPEK